MRNKEIIVPLVYANASSYRRIYHFISATAGHVFPLVPFYTSKQVQLSRGNKRLCRGKQMSAARRARHTMPPAAKGSLGFAN